MKTDSALWHQWLGEHDESAFAALVGPHLSFMFDYARRSGCDPSDADEVAQSALCELLRQKSDKPCRVGFRAWLGRSARSHIRMLRRAEGRRKRHEANAPPRDAVAAYTLDTEDEVYRALAKLDTEARELVTLRFLHDLEYNEIGCIVRSTPNACRIRVHRALKRLRKDLGNGAPAIVAALPLLAPPAEAAGSVIERALQASPRTVKWFGTAAVTSIVAICTIGAGVAVATMVAATRDHESSARQTRTTGAARRGDPQLNTDASDGAQSPTKTDRTKDASKPRRSAPLRGNQARVTGRIAFTDGTPLADARLSLGGTRTKTDAEGRYSAALARSYFQSSIQLILGARSQYVELAKLEPRLEETVHMDLELDVGSPITGRVVEAASGTPIPEVAIEMSATEKRSQASRARVKTDALGQFRIPHVPAGKVHVRMHRIGYMPYVANIELPKQAAMGDVSLEVAPQMRLRFSGAPPEARGSRISFMLRSVLYSVTLDDDWSFTVDALPPRSYQLENTNGAHIPSKSYWFVVPRRDGGPIDIPIGAGASVEGVVFDPDGKPVPNASLFIYGSTTSSCRTDAEGRFRIAHVESGPAQLMLRTVIRKPERFDSEIEIARVDVQAGGRTGLEARIPGRCVVHGRNRAVAPYIGCLVEFRRPNESEVLATTRAGPGRRFRVPHLPAGTLHMRMSADALNAADVTRVIDLKEGQEFDIGEFSLVPFPQMPVRVVVPSGSAMPRRLRVRVVVAPGSAMPSLFRVLPEGRYLSFRLDAAGGIKIGWLPPGAHTLRFVARGYEEQDVRITVAPDAPTVTIRLVPKH